MLTTPAKPTKKERAEMREAHAQKEKRTPSQLTEEEVHAIRAARAAGVGALGLALRYDVRVGAVYEIHKRRARADVPGLFETASQREERLRKHKENEARTKAIQSAVEEVLGGKPTSEAALAHRVSFSAVRRAVREARKQAKKEQA